MDTKQLRYFIEIADKLSFRETADALYISQSALSRQISELEKELGAKLFRRSTRKVELTYEGHICLKNAQRIIDEADEMKNKIVNSVENPSGTLNIGCYTNGRHTLFYELLYRLQSKYRMLDVNLTMGDIPEIKRKFARNDLDAVIALRASFAGERDLEFITVEPGRLYAVVPSVHPLADRRSLSPQELKDEKILIKNEFTRRLLEDVIKRAGIRDVEVSSESNANVSNMVRVALGDGIMLAPALGQEMMMENTGTVCIPVVDSEASDFFDEVIVKKKSNHNAAVNYLENITREYMNDSCATA